MKHFDIKLAEAGGTIIAERSGRTVKALSFFTKGTKRFMACCYDDQKPDAAWPFFIEDGAAYYYVKPKMIKVNVYLRLWTSTPYRQVFAEGSPEDLQRKNNGDWLLEHS